MNPFRVLSNYEALPGKHRQFHFRIVTFCENIWLISVKVIQCNAEFSWEKPNKCNHSTNPFSATKIDNNLRTKAGQKIKLEKRMKNALKRKNSCEKEAIFDILSKSKWISSDFDFYSLKVLFSSRNLWKQRSVLLWQWFS